MNTSTMSPEDRAEFNRYKKQQRDILYYQKNRENILSRKKASYVPSDGPRGRKRRAFDENKFTTIENNELPGADQQERDPVDPGQ